METPEVYNAEPAAPAPPQQDPMAAKIQETAHLIKQLEAEEAYHMQQIERVRVQVNRLRGRLDTLIELAQEGAIQAANGAPPSQPRPERGRPRRK